jgi:hypothetical protein
MKNLFITAENVDFATNVGFALLIIHPGILQTGKLNYDC